MQHNCCCRLSVVPQVEVVFGLRASLRSWYNHKHLLLKACIIDFLCLSPRRVQYSLYAYILALVQQFFASPSPVQLFDENLSSHAINSTL